MRYVYFPTDSIVSLLYVMEDGASAEIAMVGNEGIVGVPLFMGSETTTSRAVVQSAGEACRLKGQRLKDEVCRAGPMQRLLLRYTQAQKAGLIEYHRGHITTLDRASLEARTCECYAVVKRESDRLLVTPLVESAW